MFKYTKKAAMSLALTGSLLSAGLASSALAKSQSLDMSFAGALEFSDTGVLFVGDNYNGAIYAFDMTEGSAPGFCRKLCR